MRPAVPRERPRLPNILVGIVRVAFGRVDGLDRFGATRESFLASLAPLLAFPLVGSALLLADGAGRAGVSQLLATLCILLVPPVLSFELSRRWRRQDGWLGYATALNWCQWAIPAVAVILLALFAPLLSAILGSAAALNATILAIGLYALWLNWFLARHALALSRLRAVALVLIVNLVNAGILLGQLGLAGG